MEDLKEKMIEIVNKLNFSHQTLLKADCLKFLSEVREMCSSDRCRQFGKKWSCPPACGTLEEISRRAAKYHWGIMIQMTGTMEDHFDVEAMEETEKIHKNKFNLLVEEAKAIAPKCLPMAAGSCTLCSECTYPDAPCRFPDKAYPSMEAYGILVTEACEEAGLRYYYGPDTITFTSVILVE